MTWNEYIDKLITLVNYRYKKRLPFHICSCMIAMLEPSLVYDRETVLKYDTILREIIARKRRERKCDFLLRILNPYPFYVFPYPTGNRKFVVKYCNTRTRFLSNLKTSNSCPPTL